MLRIKQAEALENLRVRLTLTDGSVLERDLSQLLAGRVFDRVRADREVFTQVRVVDGTLEWPGGVDLCPDMIIYGGPPPVEAAKNQRRAG